MITRGSGLLMHMTSLPSRYGIGDLGAAAYAFVEVLVKSQQKYWQLLPLNPIDAIYGNSPYSSVSAFAVNPLFIDPEGLVKKGWLTKEDIAAVPKCPDGKVDYGAARALKNRLFDKAFQAFDKDSAAQADLTAFCDNQAFWLEDYALFLAAKKKFKGQGWMQWPPAVKQRDPRALAAVAKELQTHIRKTRFLQFVVFEQWQALHAYCRGRGVRLVGDMPIYVNDDSVDVWSHPQNFKLDPDGSPVVVAGVPPDYFSATGQRWGNPVYDWERLSRDGFSWWVKRLRHNLDLFDLTRIDHFRGLVGYWEVPAAEPTAVNGHWAPGPGDPFFETIKQAFPGLPIIAEDLGLITPDVTEAMDKHGFVGMKVLQFAFSGDQESHPYLPKNYPENCVAYTGTHDNNTVLGWWESDASDEEKHNLGLCLGHEIDPRHLSWDLMELAEKSRAVLAVVPVQDVLNLNGDARMNCPGTSQGNWGWRLKDSALADFPADKLAALTVECGR